MNRRAGTKPIFVYLAVRDHARLKTVAKRRGRSMTILVEDLVHAWLDAQEPPRDSRGGEQ